ncbi:MAG: TraB/GumN family protein [Spirochaetaceae bacterium]|nr:MAG: TraB/GumN family protein [Spirochaetaceae bacterium]
MSEDQHEQESLTSENVTQLQVGDRRYILVGTAHVSKESVEEVREVILNEEPDRVCIEIDETRYNSLIKKQRWQNLNIGQVLRERKGFLLLANLVLSSFQRRLGLEIGVSPGEEMLTAVQICQEQGIPFSFSDRDIQVTLRRAWARSSFWGKNKMLAAMLSSIFSQEKLDAEEIERLKTKSTFQNMMDELASYLPSVKEVLIDERDRYLAIRLYNAEGKRIVAVIGAGHVEGIIRNLNALEAGTLENDTASLEVIPPRKKISRILPYVVPAIFVALIAAGFFRSGWSLSLSMMWKWILVNGTLSAIGSLIALAHPLTIAAAFVGAPITSLNPTIGVGLLTGIVEATVRKPRVTDFENLPEDLLTFRGFFRNRITRILLVFLFSSIGSTLGTFIGIPYLTSLLR